MKEDVEPSRASRSDPFRPATRIGGESADRLLDPADHPRRAKGPLVVDAVVACVRAGSTAGLGWRSGRWWSGPWTSEPRGALRADNAAGGVRLTAVVAVKTKRHWVKRVFQ